MFTESLEVYIEPDQLNDTEDEVGAELSKLELDIVKIDCIATVTKNSSAGFVSQFNNICSNY